MAQREGCCSASLLRQPQVDLMRILTNVEAEALATGGAALSMRLLHSCSPCVWGEPDKGKTMEHLGPPPSEGAPGARLRGPRRGAGDESGREAAGLAVSAAAAAAKRLPAVITEGW